VQPIKIENLPKKQGFTSAFLKKNYNVVVKELEPL
jgi:hypothetical protein